MDNSGQPWAQQEQQLDPLAGISGDLDALDNFLDFGDIDINFDEPYGDQQVQNAPQLSHHTTPFTDIGHTGIQTGPHAQDFGQLGAHQSAGQSRFGKPPRSDDFGVDSIQSSTMLQAFNQPPQQFQYQSQPSYPSGHGVPPTPNSYELHGEVGRFMNQNHADQQQRAILDQRYGPRKDDAMTFTPMMSPACTPQYPLNSDFATPGAYFSPLTSPLLHAQNGGNMQPHAPQQYLQGFFTNPSTAPSSSATSPIDLNGDVAMGEALSLPESAVSQPRKGRRKPATPRGVTAGNKVKQSPIQKPQKRKSGRLSQVMTSSDESQAETKEIAQPASKSTGQRAVQIATTAGSEEGSTSPEPASGSVMGPPPRPASSVNPSPAINPQRQGGIVDTPGSAATPKSILSTSSTQQQASGRTSEGTGNIDADGLDDLQLPAAADQTSRKPPLTQIDTSMHNASTSGQSTPRMSARKTPKLGPSSTPSSTRINSAVESPAAGSPMNGSAPGHLLKETRYDSRSDVSNRRRSSVRPNGVASPAIRPKISPSIKPLLPEGTPLHSPQHALLLASKSNYQNLLEGNQLPGVNYPDSLSTGLTSKRTSHKVAEQGRRNRINDALKEMQSLLPQGSNGKPSKDKSNSNDDSPEVAAAAEADLEKSKEAAVKSNSSKAATVESANVYIRAMQEQMAAVMAENAALKQQLGRESQESPPLAEQDGQKATDSASPVSGKS
ncbi:hypothetical protein KC367_g1143 [Hortaea werneckii]|uniref:BHLH domain-containing protein n=2 Tax=Hortaea werneckii TaxID=91943 RepID=A0A3M7J6N1_HORWE|nr:hypothetical protein KC358_g11257 [Hortaea werneckii]OTA36522.1 hypothetical protein BTJ68_03665 [Hortaea werneckii EXF-2000]KAI6927668.1 hypothetical protein KC348_g8338 [Hortaea werneckii]KAI6934237.1 hypothetical protein KC341_g7746 [Hortaea werneckii]KAI6968848.1 hypothetical protein KC321_g8226 [Hortaea werneckii]